VHKVVKKGYHYNEISWFVSVPKNLQFPNNCKPPPPHPNKNSCPDKQLNRYILWSLVSSAAFLAQLCSGLLHAVRPAVTSPNGKLSSNWEICKRIVHCGFRLNLCKFVVNVRVVTNRLHTYAVPIICPDRTPILSNFKSLMRWLRVTTVNMEVLNVKLSLSTISRRIGRMQV